MHFVHFLILVVAQVVRCEQKVLQTPVSSPSLTVEIKTKTTSMHHRVLATAITDAIDTPQVQHFLSGTSHRILDVDSLFVASPQAKRERNGFRIPIIDYTNSRTIYVNSDDAFGPVSDLSVYVSNEQPLPSHEEMADAVSLAGFSPDAEVHTLMPPFIGHYFPNGTSNRILNMVARENDKSDFVHLHVNMNNRTATKVVKTNVVAPECSRAPEMASDL